MAFKFFGLLNISLLRKKKQHSSVFAYIIQPTPASTLSSYFMNTGRVTLLQEYCADASDAMKDAAHVILSIVQLS